MSGWVSGGGVECVRSWEWMWHRHWQAEGTQYRRAQWRTGLGWNSAALVGQAPQARRERPYQHCGAAVPQCLLKSQKSPTGGIFSPPRNSNAGPSDQQPPSGPAKVLASKRHDVSINADIITLSAIRIPWDCCGYAHDPALAHPRRPPLSKAGEEEGWGC